MVFNEFDTRDRCLRLAEYIVSSGATVRAAAKKFNISKSTVHKDVTVNLQKYHPEMTDDVKKVLEKNKDERHIRGGEATRKKYRCKKLS